jgi:hypothetical protein
MARKLRMSRDERRDIFGGQLDRVLSYQNDTWIEAGKRFVQKEY